MHLLASGLLCMWTMHRRRRQRMQMQAQCRLSCPPLHPSSVCSRAKGHCATPHRLRWVLRKHKEVQLTVQKLFNKLE